VVIFDLDESDARAAAAAAFDLLASLEQDLSRFVATSDVSRISALPPGETVLVAPDVAECLATALEAGALTDGAFDITVLPLIELWSNARDTGGEPSAEELRRTRRIVDYRLLDLDRNARRVGVRRSGVRLDLGGVAKGFALDQMRRLLVEGWEVQHGLIHGGQSTVIPLGPPPGADAWEVPLRDPLGTRGEVLATLPLPAEVAFSGSGVRVHGRHILDPRTGRPAPTTVLAAWAVAESGALSDAFSTAFMLFSREEVAAFCGRCPHVTAIQLREDRPGSGPKLYATGPFSRLL
jgi:thiamine biosynthesis lipoprotein